MTARVVGGLANGNLGVLKSFISHATKDIPEARTFAFSLMPLAWGIGSTVAPLAGGLLSNPQEKYG